MKRDSRNVAFDAKELGAWQILSQLFQLSFFNS
jgi:hypothetical protein